MRALFLMLALSWAGPALAAGPPVTLANTETHELVSTTNGQRYRVKVQFPRDYAPTDEPYPVLYVLDAETNFGGVGYIVQRLVKDGLIPPLIVVGVAYGVDYDTFYELRSRDLTPTEVSSVRVGGQRIVNPTGGASVFAAFLETELFPFVEARYRVRSDDRALYGHSYGGLFTCYVFLEKPELFQRYLGLSPSLWFDERVLLRRLDAQPMGPRPVRLYLGSGDREGRIDDLQTDFARRLREIGPPGLVMKDEVLENETHRTIFGRGFTNGLRFLYADVR